MFKQPETRLVKNKKLQITQKKFNLHNTIRNVEKITMLVHNEILNNTCTLQKIQTLKVKPAYTNGYQSVDNIFTAN